MEKINILGINITSLSGQELAETIEEFLSGFDSHYIVTPNPEIVLAAQSDEELFYILNQADLALPDGVGLQIAAWFLGRRLSRFTGADTVPLLLHRAEERGERVCIANWRGGLSRASAIKKFLDKKYPKLNYLVLDIDRQAKLFPLKRVQQFAPQIILASLGCPWQEKFIYHTLRSLSAVKIGMG
ncbi:hypothetical protein D6821_02735, partial [Candidatus Parcubacteria bacterium]